jgi:hypothetical protein
MLAAYLQGLLKPSTAYGLRSSLAESVITEGMVYQMHIANYESSMRTDASILSCLTDKAKASTLRTIGMRALRCSELRSMDIYRLDEASIDLSNKSGLSLYQLYHIAKKCGILDALGGTEAAKTDE